MNNNHNPCIEREEEEDIIKDGNLNILVVETKIWDAISKMLNLEEAQVTMHFPHIM